MTVRFLLAIVIVLCVFSGCNKEDKGSEPVRYHITFTFHWNEQDFPYDYPQNAHFSKLIGWSHKPSNTFFQAGTMASEGIELMAEIGAINPLDEEINYRIDNGEGLYLVIGDYLNNGTGSIEIDVLVSREYPSVTLATMLAPSPDWYVAVVNVNLLESGEFVKEKVVEGLVFDAGTDKGLTFTSEDLNADPQIPISLLIDPPLGNGSAVIHTIATVSFTLL